MFFSASVQSAIPSLLLFAKQWNEEGAEDVVQYALMKLYEQFGEQDHSENREKNKEAGNKEEKTPTKPSKKPPENVVGWLYAVVRNESLDRLRKKKVRTRHDRKYAQTAPCWFESQTESRLDAESVAERLKMLPLENREVIVAKIWGDLSFEEIGQLLGTSRSSAHRKYVEGLEMLKKALGET